MLSGVAPCGDEVMDMPVLTFSRRARAYVIHERRC